MGTKAERRAAVERHRAGELDAFEVDEVIHHYQRAARRLWTFCGQSGAQVELAAHAIRRMAEDAVTIDWWERGRSRR